MKGLAADYGPWETLAVSAKGAKPKYYVTKGPRSLRVVLVPGPSTGRFALQVLATVWVVVCALPFFSDGGADPNQGYSVEDLFDLVSFAAAVIASVWAFLWVSAGREILEFDPNAITRRREIFGIGSSRTFLRSTVTDLRFYTSEVGETHHKAKSFWTRPLFRWRRAAADGLDEESGQSGIAFDSGGRIYFFGWGSMTREAATEVISIIQQHYPVPTWARAESRSSDETK